MWDKHSDCFIPSEYTLTAAKIDFDRQSLKIIEANRIHHKNLTNLSCLSSNTSKFLSIFSQQLMQSTTKTIQLISVNKISHPNQIGDLEIARNYTQEEHRKNLAKTRKQASFCETDIWSDKLKDVTTITSDGSIRCRIFCRFIIARGGKKSCARVRAPLIVFIRFNHTHSFLGQNACITKLAQDLYKSTDKY